MLGLTFTKINTYGHGAEDDSCLICVSVTALKAQSIFVETAQRTALSLVKSQCSSPSTLLFLSLSLFLILRYGTALYAMRDRLDTSKYLT